jgi:hypothetical protein
MYKRHKLLFLTVLLVILMSVFLPTSAQDDTDAPFLYYYSRLHNAFIIERADGSDRVIFGSEVEGLIWDMAWSPSGQWLMWMSILEDGEHLNPSYYRTQASVIRHDDGERLTVLDHIDWVVCSEWSPTDGILLLKGTVQEPDSSRISRELIVVDANSGRIEFSTTLAHGCGQWAPDGSAIYFTDGERNQFRLVVSTWTMETIPWFFAEWSVEDCLVFIDFDADTETQRLRMEDSEGRVLFEGFLPAWRIHYVEWSPNHDYALLFTLSEPLQGIVSEPHKLWLLSLPNQSIRLISDRTITPLPCKHSTCIMPLPVKIWSPTGDRAVFPTVDGTLMWLNMADLSLEDTGLQIPSLVIEDEKVTEDFGGNILFPGQAQWGVQWSDDHAFFVLEDGVHVYDLREERFFDARIGQLLNFGVSADGRYVAQTGLCGDEFDDHGGHCLWDWRENTAINVPPPDLMGLVSGYGQVYWHNKQDWVLLADAQVYTSPFPNWSVASADGTVHRELTRCYTGAKCVDWLPDNVMVE